MTCPHEARAQWASSATGEAGGRVAARQATCPVGSGWVWFTCLPIRTRRAVAEQGFLVMWIVRDREDQLATGATRKDRADIGQRRLPARPGRAVSEREPLGRRRHKPLWFQWVRAVGPKGRIWVQERRNWSAIERHQADAGNSPRSRLAIAKRLRADFARYEWLLVVHAVAGSSPVAHLPSPIGSAAGWESGSKR
jgi:hypothetical protein